MDPGQQRHTPDDPHSTLTNNIYMVSNQLNHFKGPNDPIPLQNSPSLRYGVSSANGAKPAASPVPMMGDCLDSAMKNYSACSASTVGSCFDMTMNHAHPSGCEQVPMKGSSCVPKVNSAQSNANGLAYYRQKWEAWQQEYMREYNVLGMRYHGRCSWSLRQRP